MAVEARVGAIACIEIGGDNFEAFSKETSQCEALCSE